MKNKIYLAGGFKGGWQDDVIDKLGDNYIFYNPAIHNLDKPDEYTIWDLYHLDKSDILLGYMSAENPSGYGLALEIGYAKAKNKLIVLVDERSDQDLEFKRYYAICHESSNLVFASLDLAVDYLKNFISI